MRQRILGVAQRLAPGAQLLGARAWRRLPRLAAQARHQRGHDGVDHQHRAEQQRMLAQVDAKAPRGGTRNQLKASTASAPGTAPDQAGSHSDRQRAGEHQHHREVGQIDAAVSATSARAPAAQVGAGRYGIAPARLAAGETSPRAHLSSPASGAA